MDENQGTTEPAGAESLAPAAEATPYDDLDFQGLRDAAKERDLSAGGTAEEIKARLLEADATPAAPNGDGEADDDGEQDDDDDDAEEPTEDAPSSVSAADALKNAQALIDARHGRK